MANKVFACKNKDINTRLYSTSGGVFSILALYVLHDGGVVYGAEFDKDFRVVCSRHNDSIGISRFSGSKYPQQRIGESFKNVKSDLNEGKTVLFSGTPCQIYGLKQFLMQDYENLICLDFTCMGVGAPEIWINYLREYYGKNNKIQGIIFKDKLFGWHAWSTVIDTKKRTDRTIGIENPYMYMYLERLIIRPSCGNCPFKGENRLSDFTVSDCWGIEGFYPEFDDDAGVSALFLNTEKANIIFDRIKDKMDYIELTTEQATRRNPYYYNSVNLADDRLEFIEMVRMHGVKYSIDKRQNKSLLKKLYGRAKIVYRNNFRRRKHAKK